MVAETGDARGGWGEEDGFVRCLTTIAGPRNAGVSVRRTLAGNQPPDGARVAGTGHLVFGTLIRAIVFDFDGLILDTEEPVYRSWLEVYEAHGEDLPFERWVQIVGSTTTGFHPQHHLDERLGRSLPKEVLDRRIGRRTEMILALEALPGVVRHIQEARAMGLQLGVASSATSEWGTGHLSRLGILESFDVIRCRDDVANAKPAPHLYLAMLDCPGAGA